MAGAAGSENATVTATTRSLRVDETTGKLHDGSSTTDADGTTKTHWQPVKPATGPP